MKMAHGTIAMLTNKWLWISVVVTLVLLNYLAWIERVEWLRNIQ